jgi:tetratricopeptide (TPR) repeat protein
MYFELAWTLLGQRRYPEAAEAFTKVTNLNSWYVSMKCAATAIVTLDDYFLVAGCLLAAGDIQKAQVLFDKIPAILEKKKTAGRELPTEVYIKKKRWSPLSIRITAGSQDSVSRVL